MYSSSEDTPFLRENSACFDHRLVNYSMGAVVNPGAPSAREAVDLFESHVCKLLQSHIPSHGAGTLTAYSSFFTRWGRDTFNHGTMGSGAHTIFGQVGFDILFSLIYSRAMAHVTIMLALSARERDLIFELVREGRHAWRNVPSLAWSLLFSRNRQLRRPHKRPGR